MVDICAQCPIGPSDECGYDADACYTLKPPAGDYVDPGAGHPFTDEEEQD